jgi:hypothetical protein
MTQCVEQLGLSFHPNRHIEVSFDAPRSSSDGGVLLLRLLDDELGLSELFAAAMPDDRLPERVRHNRREQVRQRLFQLALGYEDCNDADTLRHDPALLTACDRLADDAEGLSSQPTLSRFENAITARQLKRLLLDFEQAYVEGMSRRRKLVLLDIDGTDDPTHGQQQLTFFHGYYDHYMYHPLLVFDDDGALVTALLRPGNTHSSRGAGGVLERLIRAIRRRCPHAHIIVRADSGFAMPRLFERLERLGRELGALDYIIGIARNPVLERTARPWLRKAKRQYAATGRRARLFSHFHYAAKTWPRRRRVIVKAEHLAKGSNPRFVVTSFRSMSAEELYETYCARGQCENYIKDLKNALHGDRLSCCRFRANFFRLLLHAAAYRLMHALRDHLAAVGSALARCQADTLRLRLLKVAALISQSVRRIWVRLPVVFPLAATFRAVAARLSVAHDT